MVPWEAWYFGRGAKPGEPSPFSFTYHFCFGVQQFADNYTHLWPQVPTNKTVGVMWPNDADGNAIRAALGPLLKKAGYTIVDPGAYQDGTNDYSSQIATFKKHNCEIFNTFPIPPDFATFWRQAAQQGYTQMVKIAQIAKTGLFQSQVDALGEPRQEPRHRVLLGPDLAVQVVAHRHLERRPGIGLRGRRRTSSGTSSSARAWPCSTSPTPRSRPAATPRTRSRWQTR